MHSDRRATIRSWNMLASGATVLDDREFNWRLLDETTIRSGWKVEESPCGVAFIAESTDAPNCGARIANEALRARLARWAKVAVVTEVEEVSQTLRLVCCEYEPVPEVPADCVPPAVQPDRRSHPRPTPDRRRSHRWPMHRELVWRARGGRRSRRSWLVQRSLDGLVMLTEPSDAPRPGMRFRPWHSEDRERLGFITAVVRRVETTADRRRIVFAEIEA